MIKIGPIIIQTKDEYKNQTSMLKQSCLLSGLFGRCMEWYINGDENHKKGFARIALMQYLTLYKTNKDAAHMIYSVWDNEIKTMMDQFGVDSQDYLEY